MPRTTVAVHIDLANISAGFDIIKKERGLPYNTRMDYSKLVAAITLGSDVISKTVYTGTRTSLDDAARKAQRGFMDYFKNSGFKVVTKEAKCIRLEDGSTKNKANFDVEITSDVCCHIWKRECGEVILLSGDSDFAYLVDRAKDLDFKISIVSSKATVSTELRQRADRLILLDDLDFNYLAFDGRRRS